jgi:hypothetical protein
MAGNRSRWDERRKSYSLRSAIGHKPYAICSSLSGRGGRLAGLRVPKKTPDPFVLIGVAEASEKQNDPDFPLFGKDSRPICFLNAGHLNLTPYL